MNWREILSSFFFVITVHDIYIPVVYYWEHHVNTAKFFWTIGDRINRVPL